MKDIEDTYIGPVVHSRLGSALIDEECIELQKYNTDAHTIFINVNGELVEVSRNLVEKVK